MSSAQANPTSPIDRWPLRAGFGIALLAVLPYLQTLRHDFVGLDDPIYVLQNPHLGHPFDPAFLLWALTGSHDGNWFPLTWWSHAVDVALHGRWAPGHHATSLVLHAVCSVFFFAFLRRATGRSDRAAVAAALFAVHPLHVESVAWVAERKDVLSSAFGFAALWAYAAAMPAELEERRGFRLLAPGGGVANTRYGWGVLLAFAASLASKPMWVTLPFVLLLLDVWPFRRLSVRAVTEKLPLFALSAGSAAITLAVQRGDGAMVTGASLEPWQRIANALVSVVVYLRRTFWPSDLSPFYPHPYLPSEGGLPWSGSEIGAAAVLLATLAFLIARRPRSPFAIGLLWFGGMLVPVLGLLQVGGQGMADRYVYAPLAGVLVATVWPAADRMRAWAGSEARRSTAAWIGSAAAVLVLAALSFVQAGAWRDSRSLYESGLASNPRALTFRYALAVLERDEGNDEAAIAHYRKALETDPRSARALNGIGVTLLKQGDLPGARLHFERALDLHPELSFALNHLGTVHRRSGEAALAEVRLREALAVRPDYAAAHLNLAELLCERDRFDEAEAHFRSAVAARPRSFPAWQGWIEGLLEAGRRAEAQQVLESAERSLPDHPGVAGLRARISATRAPGASGLEGRRSGVDGRR